MKYLKAITILAVIITVILLIAVINSKPKMCSVTLGEETFYTIEGPGQLSSAIYEHKGLRECND